MITKYFFYTSSFLFLLFISSCNSATEQTKEENSAEESAGVFDEALAKQYGADEYGMKLYVMAFLKRGPNRSEDKEVANKLQSAHMENINKLAEEGKLVLAGPFGGNGDLRGIYIFDTESVEEAESWTKTDPAIIAGSLEMELVPWYGSAAVMAISDLHSKIAKTNI